MANLEGVSDIETDPATNLCKFKLSNKSLDLKAKLAEIAKSNDHVAGFEIVSGLN